MSNINLIHSGSNFAQLTKNKQRAHKAKLVQEAMFFVIIFKKVIIQVQNGYGALNRLVQCLKCIELCSLLSTLGQFGPVLLP